MEKDITGVKFNRLTAVGRIGSGVWLYLCACGTLKKLDKHEVSRGKTKSCGCLRREYLRKPRTHGKSNDRIYSIYRSMHKRCYNKGHLAYSRYGGAGILVTKKWHTFEGFYKDMGDPPTTKHTIDRIDNSKGYDKSNCKWSTMKEQQSNRKNNRLVTYKGKTKTVSQWSEETGINRITLFWRLSIGKTGDDLFKKPKQYIYRSQMP